MYRLGLRIIGMGDLNAVDIAHVTHARILESEGRMAPGTVVEYGRVMPDSSLLEFLYIDDHIVAHICRRSEALAATGPDRELIEASHRAYAAAGLPRADEKGFGFAATRAEVCRRMLTLTSKPWAPKFSAPSAGPALRRKRGLN